VHGFVDSIEVLRSVLPERKDSFKLATLADHFKISAENAHDALADVRILSAILTAAKVDKRVVMKHAKTICHHTTGKG